MYASRPVSGSGLVSSPSGREVDIESLHSMQALALALIVTQGLSYRQVAARMELSPKDTLGLINGRMALLRRSL